MAVSSFPRIQVFKVKACHHAPTQNRFGLAQALAPAPCSESMPPHGGKRTGAGRPSNSQQLAKSGAKGATSVAQLFGRPAPSAAAASEATPAVEEAEPADSVSGERRGREPGGTPTKEDVSRPRASAASDAAGGAGPSSAAGVAANEVEVIGERSRADRDAEGRASAILVDECDATCGEGEPSPVHVKHEPKCAPPPPEREPQVDSMLTGMLSSFSRGLERILSQLAGRNDACVRV